MIAIQVRKPKISYRSVNSNGDAAIRRKMKYSEQSVSIIVILIHFRFYAIHTVERGHRDGRYKYRVLRIGVFIERPWVEI